MFYICCYVALKAMRDIKEVFSTDRNGIVNERLATGKWVLLGYEKLRSYQCVNDNTKEFKDDDRIVYVCGRVED